MFKKIITMLLAVMFICCGCGKKKETPDTLKTIQQRGTVVVGVRTDTYPFGFLDKKGHYAGYDVELAKLIAKKLFGSGGHLKYVKVNASDRMMKLYSEEIDMIIATMSVTPSREQILDFSDPYYISGQALLVKKGSNIKGLRDLKGKRAIIVFGSTGERSLRAAIPDVGILGYKTYEEAFNALKRGKGVALVSDDSILMGLAANDPTVELLPKKYSNEPYAVAFRKGDESKNLIKEVNDILTEEGRNGTLKKLQEKYGIKQH